jgi:hypothetical protein
VASGESQHAQQNWRYCGGQIKLWREEAGVSRQDLAGEARYDYEYVKSMECGRRRPTLRLFQVADQMCSQAAPSFSGICLEVAYTWRKSSHSDSQGGACLEVAVRPRTIHIRDSKLGTQSPRFAVRCDAWTAFLGYASREI